MDYNRAISVTGPLKAEEMGTTYVHEHLLVKPQLLDEKYEAYTLDDKAASTREVESFLKAGGQTIVEMTPINYGRRVSDYAEISKATGVNIICCTGYHKQLFMPKWFAEKTELQLYDILMDEIENGIDATDIKPGVIKFGTSYNEITNQEKRAIKAVVRAHKDSGLPISTHCDKGTMGMEQLKLLEQLGADLNHVLFCHIDSVMDIEYAKALCRAGVTICFDHVGREIEAKDYSRIKMIRQLAEADLLDSLTLSGDMGKKEYLCAYGGKPGLSYILTDLKAQLEKFLSADDLEKLFILNPMRIFTKNNT